MFHIITLEPATDISLEGTIVHALFNFCKKIKRLMIIGTPGPM